jgi:hypothetical protein
VRRAPSRPNPPRLAADAVELDEAQNIRAAAALVAFEQRPVPVLTGALGDKEYRRCNGTSDAAPLRMEEQPESNARERSKLLIDAARQLRQRAGENLQTSRLRLDEARNTLHAIWLVRALRERLRRRDG